jgi:hypothetical protein
MKKTEVANLLREFQKHAETIQHNKTAEKINAVMRFINQLPGTKLADCIKSAELIVVTRTSGNGTACTDCATAISAYSNLIKTLGKAPIAAKLDTVSATLQSRNGTFIEDLAFAIESLPAPKVMAKGVVAQAVTNEALVAKYNKLLEQALGDDPGFQAIVAKLASDPEVTSNEMIALAKRFTATSTKTKPAALKKISSRHTAIMSSRARTAATGGRSAG